MNFSRLFWDGLFSNPDQPQTTSPKVETAQSEPGAAQPKPHMHTSQPKVETVRVQHEPGAAKLESQPVPEQNQPTCFRISGIPSGWNRKRLEEALRGIDTEFDRLGAEIYGPFPNSLDLTNTALLNVNKCTSYFTFKPDEEKYVVIREHGQKVHLVLDKHFYDLTPLNRVDGGIEIDVIAITGLGGHAFNSWRSHIDTPRPIDRPMWLCDFLPERFPKARIMTYGYESSLKKSNGANMTDYRRNFIQCLQNCRRGCPDRPIAFIGHSLGGILVVQTLIEAKNAGYNDLFKSVRCIFFFATPHQGLKTPELEEMVDREAGDYKGQAHYLLAQLKEGSEYLENQREALTRLWEVFKGEVATFYELNPTDPAKKLAPELCGLEGKEVQVVERLSAQLYLPRESRHPVNSNHVDLVKFSSPRDGSFQSVVTILGGVIGPRLPTYNEAKNNTHGGHS